MRRRQMQGDGTRAALAAVVILFVVSVIFLVVQSPVSRCLLGAIMIEFPYNHFAPRLRSLGC
jgi:hypothetical protein